MPGILTFPMPQCQTFWHSLCQPLRRTNTTYADNLANHQIITPKHINPLTRHGHCQTPRHSSARVPALKQTSASTEALNCQHWNKQACQHWNKQAPALKNTSASTQTLKCQHWNTQVPALQCSSARTETLKCQHWGEPPRTSEPIITTS